MGLQRAVEAERAACQRRILVPIAEVARVEEGVVELRFPPDAPHDDRGRPASIGPDLEASTAYGGGPAAAESPAWRGRLVVVDGVGGRITLRLRDGNRPPPCPKTSFTSTPTPSSPTSPGGQRNSASSPPPMIVPLPRGR